MSSIDRLKRLGPFWPDMIEPGVWGIEAQGLIDHPMHKVHYVLTIREDVGTVERAGQIASDICDILNSACGNKKHTRGSNDKSSKYPRSKNG